MSAMKVIDHQEKGGEMILFESFCGGLVARIDTNLWNYKFTWAPRMWCLPVKVAPSLYRKEQIHSVL
jgi:hypothetical protein